MKISQIVITLCISMGCSFFAVVVYSDYCKKWLPYWPFGIVPIACAAIAMAVYLTTKP